MIFTQYVQIVTFPHGQNGADSRFRQRRVGCPIASREHPAPAGANSPALPNTAGVFDLPLLACVSAQVPKRQGKYTAWLIVTDLNGNAADVGLPKEFDEVVLKQWSFEVSRFA